MSMWVGRTATASRTAAALCAARNGLRPLARFASSRAVAAAGPSMIPARTALPSRTATRSLATVTDAFRKQVMEEALFEQALWRVLPLMCERGSWSSAKGWSIGSDKITCTAWFSDAGVDSAARRAKGTSIAFDDAGVITEVRATGEPFVSDTMLVVPAFFNGQVRAVFEFESEHKREPNYTMAEDFKTLAGAAVAAEIDHKVRPVLNSGQSNVESDMSERTGLPNMAPFGQAQMDAVYDLIVRTGAYHPSVVYEDVSYFYNELGLSRDFFDRFEPEELAQAMSAYISAKKLAASADPTIGKDPLQENIYAQVRVGPNTELYIAPFDRAAIMPIEQICDSRRVQLPAEKTLSIARYVSKNSAVPYGEKRMVVYIIDEDTYGNPNPGILETSLAEIAGERFLQRRTEVHDKYSALVQEKLQRLSPLIKILPEEPGGITPVIIGSRSSADPGQELGMDNRVITDLLSEKMVANRKFYNKFSNGLAFHSIYLESTDREKIERFLREAAMTTLIPSSAMKATLPLLTNQLLSAEQYAYANAGSNFVYYFMSDNADQNLSELKAGLGDDAINLARLQAVTGKMQREALPMSRIEQCVADHTTLIKDIFDDFDNTFNPSINSDLGNTPQINAEIDEKIYKTVVDPLDRKILSTFLRFNSSVRKTNFFNERKSTLAFRLEPDFITNISNFPLNPYGIFMVMSDDFRGFHVRFQPIARGGVRIIQSLNPLAAAKNRMSLFQEQYGLAYTQNLKNKDIPEFGSKGTVLLEPECQNSQQFAFSKYMSGMMDLLLPEASGLVDHHGKEELVFFGPDEGTADYMEWAPIYAKSRGYRYWKATTTGKPAKMGGIPHDVYGMTTRSVHEFVVCQLARDGIEEESITKLQTGGPDGDLGSNEILMSKDNTIGVLDAKGTVFDPNGLDRTELERLAHGRLTVDKFDRSKLSPDGAFVGVDDENVTLPDGTVVESGLLFRNEFHFHPLAKADLFVPCGGRPESVNGSNVHLLIDEEGKSKFKYIVEGANLFFTQEARGILEAAGAVLFKDASTNKGGVTCSSMEVLAALCMNDDEHDEHMCVNEGETCAFYDRYVDEIIDIVHDNARLEFNVISDEHARTGTARHVLTHEVSDKINEINIECQSSDLLCQPEMRLAIMRLAIPKTLQELVGLENIIERLPEDYIKAVLGYWVASRYVYKNGLQGNEFAFFEFMLSITDGTFESSK